MSYGIDSRKFHSIRPNSRNSNRGMRLNWHQHSPRTHNRDRQIQAQTIEAHLFWKQLRSKKEQERHLNAIAQQQP